MPLTEGMWNPGSRQLRQFGLAALVGLPLFGWLWGAEGWWLLGLALVGAILALLGLLQPQALKPLFLGLSLITLPVGGVVREVVLVLLYFAVFVPMGLVFRLLGRDALQLRLDSQARSYWQPRQESTDPGRYYRPW